MDNPEQPKKEFLKANEIPAVDLVNRYGIPREEAQAFYQSIRLYPPQGTLITEGNLDRTLFIVRWGSVSIFRRVGNVQKSKML